MNEETVEIIQAKAKRADMEGNIADILECQRKSLKIFDLMNSK